MSNAGMPLPAARVASINVGRAQRFEGDGDGKAFRSAILKGPVAGRVELGEEGVDGDQQADRRYHGGPEKAVYVYALEHLAFWQQALRCDPLPPGTFGENLTIAGWSDLEGTLHVGDTLAIGDATDPGGGAGSGGATIQLTTPRQPCWKLERRMGLPGFAKAFLESRRIGSYARVVKPGSIAAGDPIRVIARSPRAATLRDLIDAWHFRDPDARARVLADDALDESLRRRLSSPAY